MIRNILFLLCLFTSTFCWGVNGKVIDSDTKESLPYVTVYVLNKKIGTITDFDGYYNIEVSTGDTIKFSFISYNEQIIIVDEKWLSLIHI